MGVARATKLSSQSKNGKEERVESELKERKNILSISTVLV